MSKKRTEVKMYWKKQKFGMFFLKVFVPFILAVSVLGAIVTEMLISMYNNSLDNAKEHLDKVVNTAEQEVAKNFRNAADGKVEKAVDYEFQTAENAFAGTMEYYCSMARLAVIGDLDSEDGVLAVYHRDADGSTSKVASTGEHVFMGIDDADGKTYYLSCTPEEDREMFKEMYKVPSSGDMQPLEIYVKGNNYWVGKYTYIDCDEDFLVTEEDGTTEFKDDYTVYTVTNDNIPDGYVRLDMSKGFRVSLNIVGGSLYCADIDEYENVDELIDAASEADSDGVHGYAEKEYKCGFGHHTTEVSDLGNGYYIVSDFHTNIWKSLVGVLIIYTWAGIVILCVILSLAIAYAMYKTYLSAYDMEQYRRTTSNAMAHDLKSPLAVIQLNAENLRDGTNPEKNRHYTDNIINEVHQMNTQIASILDMAKAEDVNTKLHKTDVDITAIVNSVAEEYVERIKEKNVSIEVNGACTVHADETLMNQAIKNIMDNAVKYVTDGGHITVELSDKEVSFVNSSEPLEKDVLADVWKPFVKGDNSRHGHKGTGLGLSIVKTIMDRHGFGCEMDNCDGGVEVRLIFKK